MEPGKLYKANRRELLYPDGPGYAQLGIFVDVWPGTIVIFLSKGVIEVKRPMFGVLDTVDREFRYTFLADGRRCGRNVAENFEVLFEKQFDRVSKVEDVY